LKRLTRETLEVDEADDKLQLTTFKAELKSRDFVVTLVKSPPRKYMNAKDALAAIRDEEKPREREGKKEDWRGQKRERGKSREFVVALVKSPPRMMAEMLLKA